MLVEEVEVMMDFPFIGEGCMRFSYPGQGSGDLS